MSYVFPEYNFQSPVEMSDLLYNNPYNLLGFPMTYNMVSLNLSEGQPLVQGVLEGFNPPPPLSHTTAPHQPTAPFSSVSLPWFHANTTKM